jgi:flagellar protein FliS
MRNVGAYKSNAVESATPARVVVMLYEEAIRRLVLVQMGMPEGGQVWREHLHHARAILGELEIALDDQAAPDLCARLRALYRWSMSELIAAGSEVSVERVAKVERVLTTLGEGWREAAVRVGEAR